MNSPFITFAGMGRLGNNLFMIANIISKGIKHNLPFYVAKNQVYGYNLYKDNLYRKINFWIDDLPSNGRNRGQTVFTYERLDPYQDVPTIYHGYYQSEKFFYENREFIKWFFEPSEQFTEKVYREFPELLTNKVTAINVRRGDYLLPHHRDKHPTISSEYIHEASKYIDTDVYFVVSDDLDWCKQNIKLPNVKFINYSNWEALWLLSLCHNFIISNSTFSWWAAYLSKHKDKKVIGPYTWHTPNEPNDLFCENWIALPTIVKQAVIFPT